MAPAADTAPAPTARRTASFAVLWDADDGTPGQVEPDADDLPAGQAMPCYQLPAAGAVPPTSFPVFHAGVNAASKGNFLFDQLAAQSVMAEYADQGNRKFMDYDHAATVDGVKAIAAAWYDLEVRDAGTGPELWAVNLTWTPPAQEHLANQEYAYFSPWFDYDVETMRVLRLRNIALTNYPSLKRLRQLIAASAAAALSAHTPPARAPATEDHPMAIDKKALCAKLGLPETATDAEIDAKLTALTAGDRVTTELAALTGSADLSTSLGKVRGWQTSAADAATLREAAKTADTAALTGKVEALVATAKTDGRLAPAQVDLATKMGKRVGAPTAANPAGDQEGLRELEAWLAGMPKKVVVSGSGAQGGERTELPADQGAAQLAPLTAEQHVILTRCQVSADQFTRHSTARLKAAQAVGQLPTMTVPLSAAKLPQITVLEAQRPLVGPEHMQAIALAAATAATKAAQDTLRGR